jgi:lactoylglutathione lyase
VGSLDEAKDWYSKAFQSSPYFDEPFYVGFNIGGFELGLVPEDEVMDEKSANVLTYWGVDDIEAEFQRLIGLGAQEYEKPNNVGGEIIVAGVKDLWGNVIGIIYNPVFTIPNR